MYCFKSLNTNLNPIFCKRPFSMLNSLTVWEIINTHEFPFPTSSSSSSCPSSHKHMWRLTTGRRETKLEHCWQCVMRRTWCLLRLAAGIINPTLCLSFAQPASITACGGLDVQEWSSRAGPALNDDCLFSASLDQLYFPFLHICLPQQGNLASLFVSTPWSFTSPP